MHWLLADDNDLDLQIARRALLQADPYASIVEVSTGRDAIREILAGDFDGVLTDVQMPSGTGHHVVDVARARRVPVIAVMTGLVALAPQSVPILDKGASDFPSQVLSLLANLAVAVSS